MGFRFWCSLKAIHGWIRISPVADEICNLGFILGLHDHHLHSVAAMPRSQSLMSSFCKKTTWWMWIAVNEYEWMVHAWSLQLNWQSFGSDHQIMRCEPHSASRHRRSVDFVSQLQRNRMSRAMSTRETRVLHCRLIDADLHGTNARDCGRPTRAVDRPLGATMISNSAVDVCKVHYCLHRNSLPSTIILWELRLMDTKWTTTGTQGPCHKGERGRGLVWPGVFSSAGATQFSGHTLSRGWHMLASQKWYQRVTLSNLYKWQKMDIAWRTIGLSAITALEHAACSRCCSQEGNRDTKQDGGRERARERGREWWSSKGTSDLI